MKKSEIHQDKAPQPIKIGKKTFSRVQKKQVKTS